MSEHPVKDQIFIGKLTDIILANLGNEYFGVNELVHEAGISYYSLKRRLQAITNKTIKQFIREVRLQRALEILQNEEVTVSDVAYKVGFGSPAYFNTCFHELFGFPPGAVRKGDFIKTKETDSVHVRQKQKKNARRTVFLLSSGILIFTVIAYLIYYVFSINASIVTGISASNREKSIAILPFKNLSDTVANQYFIDGLMEEILANLSKIHELRVISRTSVEPFRGTNKSSSEIGKKLNADYIVEGSGQKYGNIFYLRVQLIDASTDKHIWTESYEQEINEVKDILGIQSQIAQSIAIELKAVITPEEKQLIENVPTSNMTAWILYLKANDYQKDYEKVRDLGSYLTCVNLYNDALELDSVFAKAYSGLAKVYFSRYYFENYFEEGFLDSCLVLANRALTIDDQLDEAYYIKGLYYLENENISGALDNFDKAIKINPNYYLVYKEKGYILRSRTQDFVQALDNFHKALKRISGPERPALLRELAFTYQVVGFIDKANNYIKEAFALDGDSVEHFYRLSLSELSLENFEEALKLIKRAFEIDSTFNPGLTYVCYSITGHDEEAYLIAKKLSEYYKKSGELNLYFSHRLGYAFEKAGRHEEAMEYFNQQIKYGQESIKLDRDYARNGLAYYDLAATYAFLGNKEKAYEYLDKSNTMNFCPLWVLSLSRNDPLFNTIHNEERWKKIIQYLEAKYQAEHERVRKWLEEQGMV